MSIRFIFYGIWIAIICKVCSAQQQRFSFDFGSTLLDGGTTGYVNNIARSYNAGTVDEVRLINRVGVQTEVILQVTDDFRNINSNGTQLPDASLPYRASQTIDNFFGNTIAFNGSTNPTGAFVLKGLNPDKRYSFEIFASRMNVTDNRETSYTITGQTVHTTFLDAANNTQNTTTVFNVVPDAQGEIEIQLTAGSNNTNPYGFFHISAMELLEHDGMMNAFSWQPELYLTYPLQPAIWEEGKTVHITWESIGVQDVLLERSDDNGMTWNTITRVPGVAGIYHYTVPTGLGQFSFRVSGNNFSSQSAMIKVIPDDGVVYDITILGSSTAAGTGPSHQLNTWVNKYARFLYELDTRYAVDNLAIGGQVTYNLLPTGSMIPTGVNETVVTTANVTAAIANNADGMIINLPSNDAARSYPVANQISNYNSIITMATAAQIPVWQTTPQPRDFGTNTNDLSIQKAMLAATWQRFPTTTVDFWTGFPKVGDNGLLVQYDSGDGVHANNAAHQIFFERMVLADIHTQIKKRVDAALNIADVSNVSQIRFYPIFTNDTVFIEDAGQGINYYVYDTQNRIVLSGSTFQSIDITPLNSGCYLLLIEDEIHRILKQ